MPNANWPDEMAKYSNADSEVRLFAILPNQTKLKAYMESTVNAYADPVTVTVAMLQ